MRKSGLIVALLVLTGCQSLTRNNDKAGEPEKVTPVAKIERGFCLFDEPPEGFEHNCDTTYWLNTWIAAANQPWLERKQVLKALSDSAFDTLHAYLLTLPTDTPYQDRLRAQLALDDIAGTFTPTAQEVINVIAASHNNQIMQLESAMVVLEQENTLRGEKLKALEKEAVNLRKKLEELLQIEATLMDKNRSTQQ
ncbi:hypothetical protein E5672_03470 [Alteromonas portus]|uniref:Uncharacterized protein n=1 Tax=Alteromonas portus TaxID=2565549 RepID=A0A4U0ZP16_9ALTE|nr:hypothetical protein [Alteromonas portus]TKB05159.1 hypothetical protein E5672_03470 [Alteromonas portus]